MAAKANDQQQQQQQRPTRLEGESEATLQERLFANKFTRPTTTCDANNNAQAGPVVRERKAQRRPQASRCDLAPSNSSGDFFFSKFSLKSQKQQDNKGKLFALFGLTSQPVDPHQQPREQVKQSSHDLELSSSQRSESSSSQLSQDDWHLLEIDEHTLSSSYSAQVADHYESSSIFSPRRGQRQVVETTMRPDPQAQKTLPDGGIARTTNLKKAKSRKYVNIDPLAHGGERLSPRLMHLCTTLYSLLPLVSLFTFSLLISLLFTRIWFVTVAYYSYLLYDSKTCNRGGRRWDFVYKSKFWTYLAAYFPITLRHSQEFQLDPNENYILNYHPHGISAFGCVATFATNGLNFTRLFPDIRSRFMVHETSFLVPVMRETFLFRGDCSVNSTSFDYLLERKWRLEQAAKLSTATADGGGSASSHETTTDTQKQKQQQQACGNLLALCGGGLAEADLSDKEVLKIVCATRKGIVKKALIHGAHLIPCIAFGENSVFNKVNLKEGSLLQRLEAKWYQLFKFKHPIYHGRSLFAGDRSRGVLPYKRPITVVMGDPLPVKRVPEPSQEQIDQLHASYMQSLKSMYEDNKDLCDKYDLRLELV